MDISNFISYDVAQNKKPMRERVEALQIEVAKLPQYEPKTTHYFHAGMYCREVWRDAGVLVIGKVHKKEHFYMIVSGTLQLTTDDGVEEITGPRLLMSKAGTKRAVMSLTDALCMTFHIVNSTNVEDAEKELIEDDPSSMYDAGNTLNNKFIEVEL